MISYKYDELKYAELIHKKGFQTKYIFTELRLLVLYYRDVLNLKPKQREICIYEFCRNKIPNFKKERYFKTINKALKLGNKKHQKLISISELQIYKNELEYINSLDIRYECKKVMFAFLVQNKLNKIIYEYKYEKSYDSIYFKGGKKKYNNIKKMANIPEKISIHDDIINELANLKYITILHKGIILLNYLNECISDKNDEIKIIIKDYENVGLYLDYYNEIKGVKKCDNCDKTIRVKNNRQKYCDECAIEIQFNQKKEWDRTRRVDKSEK